MGLLDRIADKTFIKLKDGRTAFYPFGVFTKGYVVTGPRRMTTLHAAMKRLDRELLIMLPIMIVPGVWYSWSRGLLGTGSILVEVFILLSLIPCAIWARWRLKNPTQGLLKTEKRLSFRVFTLQHGISIQYSFYDMLAFLIILLYSIFELFSGGEFVESLKLTICSGLFFAVFGYVYWLKLGARWNRPNV